MLPFPQAGGGVWFGIAGQHPLTLREEPDGLLFENIGWEEFEGFWRDYFDLDRDYGAILEGFPGTTACGNAWNMPLASVSCVRTGSRR